MDEWTIRHFIWLMSYKWETLLRCHTCVSRHTYGSATRHFIELIHITHYMCHTYGWMNASYIWMSEQYVISYNTCHTYGHVYDMCYTTCHELHMYDMSYIYSSVSFAKEPCKRDSILQHRHMDHVYDMCYTTCIVHPYVTIRNVVGKLFYVTIYIYIWKCVIRNSHMYDMSYSTCVWHVLCCRIESLVQGSFAKETLEYM